MSTKEQVKELLNEGFSPKEIAEKTGLKTATVSTYKSMLNKQEEEEPIPAKRDTYKKVADLTDENAQLKKSNNSISDELERLKDKYEKLSKEYIELSSKPEEIYKNGDPHKLTNRIKHLEEQCEKLKEDYISARKSFESEKVKHAALLNYLMAFQ